jgi:hypothetical protein
MQAYPVDYALTLLATPKRQCHLNGSDTNSVFK